MQPEELKNTIKLLETRNADKNPKLRFDNMGHDGESFIKGNQAGLELFAAELLNAADRVEDLKIGTADTLFININKDWIDDRIGMTFIEPVVNFETEEKDPYKFDWKDTLVKYGCLTILAFLLLGTIVGLITMVKWFA